LTVLNDEQISVAGVVVTRVEMSIDVSTFEKKSEYAIDLNLIWTLKPTASNLSAWGLTQHQWAEKICLALIHDRVADSHLPQPAHVPKLAQFAHAMEEIWSEDCVDEYVFSEKGMDSWFWEVLDECATQWTNVAIIRCVNGYIGLADPGVKAGDTVAVLLGCRVPVILRPLTLTTSDNRQTWEVVSVAKIAGLMLGEAIYGDKLPLHWQAVKHGYSDEQGVKMIHNEHIAIYDTEENTLRTDPAEILQDMGIRVKCYQREPHYLEVSPESLRGAGIPLQDFILV
jgi:hypothetical protein